MCCRPGDRQVSQMDDRQARRQKKEMTATATVRLARLPPPHPTHPRPPLPLLATGGVCDVCCVCVYVYVYAMVHSFHYLSISLGAICLLPSIRPFGRSPFGRMDGWMSATYIHTYMLIMLHTHYLPPSLTHCPSFYVQYYRPANDAFIICTTGQAGRGEVTHRPARQQVGDG